MSFFIDMDVEKKFNFLIIHIESSEQIFIGFDGLGVSHVTTSEPTTVAGGWDFFFFFKKSESKGYLIRWTQIISIQTTQFH